MTALLMTIILTHTPSPVHSTVPELLALVHLPVIDMIPVPLPFRHPHLLQDPALPQCPACLQCVDRSQSISCLVEVVAICCLLGKSRLQQKLLIGNGAVAAAVPQNRGNIESGRSSNSY